METAFWEAGGKAGKTGKRPPHIREKWRTSREHSG